MSNLSSKERPQFVPAVRKPKLPYLCAGAECVTCKRPVSGDWGLVPDECDTCDAERHARYYRECAQWADAENERLAARTAELEKAVQRAALDWLALDGQAQELEARNAELVKALEEAQRDARRWRLARQYVSAMTVEDWQKMLDDGHAPSEEGNSVADDAVDQMIARAALNGDAT